MTTQEFTKYDLHLGEQDGELLTALVFNQDPEFLSGLDSPICRLRNSDLVIEDGELDVAVFKGVPKLYQPSLMHYGLFIITKQAESSQQQVHIPTLQPSA